MNKIVFVFLTFLSCLSVEAQTSDSLRSDDASINKEHNEIIKVNLFPMIGGRLSFDYEFGLQSKKHRSSMLFGVDAYGVFPVTQYQVNDPKGYAANLTVRRYFENVSTNVLDGGFVQLSGRLAYLSHIEPRSVLIAPSQYITVNERINNPHATVFVGLGKQFVLYQRFSIEYMAGFGVYINSNDLAKEGLYAISPQSSPTVAGFWNYEDTPLALTCSIKMGYVFGSFLNK
jgi:hypothetical protein